MAKYVIVSLAAGVIVAGILVSTHATEERSMSDTGDWQIAHADGADRNLSGHGSHASQSRGRTVTVTAGDTVEVTTQGSELAYSVTEIRAPADSEITIRYVNNGSMPHNIIVVNGPDDIDPVGIAALQAFATDFVPYSEEDRILGYTSMADPDETVHLTLTVPPPGRYPYICTFPGHFRAMQGVLVARE